MECNLGDGRCSTKWYEQCCIYEKYVYLAFVSVFQWPKNKVELKWYASPLIITKAVSWLSFYCKENSFGCFNVMQRLSHLKQGEKLLKLRFLAQKFKNPKLKSTKCYKFPEVYRLRELFDSSQALTSISAWYLTWTWHSDVQLPHRINLVTDADQERQECWTVGLSLGLYVVQVFLHEQHHENESILIQWVD